MTPYTSPHVAGNPSVQAAWASPSPLQALEKTPRESCRSLDPRASDPSQCVRITPATDANGERTDHAAAICSTSRL